MEPTNENNGGMAKWQTGVWVKNCTRTNYPHYCSNIIGMRNYYAGVAEGILEVKKAEDAAKQEKQDAPKRKVKEDVCKDCHKIHSAPTPNCRLA
jgi:hypothetical protein